MYLKTFAGKLTYGKQCDNITIRKGVTDRRFAPHSLVKKVTAQFEGPGGYFFVLLSLPNAYPVLKHAKPKLSTLSKSAILIVFVLHQLLLLKLHF